MNWRLTVLVSPRQGARPADETRLDRDERRGSEGPATRAAPPLAMAVCGFLRGRVRRARGLGARRILRRLTRPTSREPSDRSADGGSGRAARARTTGPTSDPGGCVPRSGRGGRGRGCADRRLHTVSSVFDLVAGAGRRLRRRIRARDRDRARAGRNPPRRRQRSALPSIDAAAAGGQKRLLRDNRPFGPRRASRNHDRFAEGPAARPVGLAGGVRVRPRRCRSHTLRIRQRAVSGHDNTPPAVRRSSSSKNALRAHGRRRRRRPAFQPTRTRSTRSRGGARAALRRGARADRATCRSARDP